MSHSCCGGAGSKHRKILAIFIGLIFLAIVVVSIASVAWKIRQQQNQGFMMNGNFGQGQMMNRGKGFYPSPTPINAGNQFSLPQDASKSGELAIVVSGLDSAKKAVSDIASKNAGNVYATFISYASNNLKNGTIVVQVPAENFDGAFADLKKVGSQVVQESTQQIAPNNFYPVPMNATAPASTNQSGVVAESAPASNVGIATFPTPSQQIQNKGYIKVIFVDYGSKVGGGEGNERGGIAGNILGVGNPENESMRNNLLVVVGIKLIFLIAILGLLVVIFKKIFHAAKRRKENVKKVHVVRQLAKTHKRVVKIQAKKKK